MLALLLLFADPPPPRPLPAVLPVAATDPLLRSEPAVALDWTGPAVVRKGQPNAYTLTVKNTSRGFVQQVTVQVRPPEGATLADPKPAAKAVDGVYVWEVGTLEPGEAKPLTLTVTGGKRGDLQCQAWVTFTGTAGMTVKVQETALTAKLSAPATVPLGDHYELTATITNTGDTQLDRLTLSQYDETGRRISGGVQTAGLAVGESRVVRLPVVARSAGAQKYTVQVEPQDGSVPLAVTSAATRHIAPALTATVTGPDKLLVGRKGGYTLTVRNTGELPIEGAVATVPLPAGLRSLSGADRLTFPLGTLKPGDVATRSFDATAAGVGVQPLVASVGGSRGASATAECRTAVDGVPALRVEMVDLQDPVERGQHTTYEIRITNTGTKADEGVKLVCELPMALEVVSATGPTAAKPTRIGVDFNKSTATTSTVEFDPIRELAPKTEAVFRVKAKAAAAGDARFKAVVTSKHLATPVVKEESTRVYGD